MTPMLPSLRLPSPNLLPAVRERFGADALPALSKRLCQHVDAMPQSRAGTGPQPFKWRATLTPDQAAALAIAREETGYASPPAPSAKLRNVWRAPPPGASAEATEDWKKARRKEQCRINQANYRKRKRQYEQKLVGKIKVLQHDIDQLEAHRAKGLNGGKGNPIQAIGDFYYAVGVEGGASRPDIKNCRLADGSSPALQCLLDLQREEFDSVESLKLHWLWYREQFRVFQLSIASCERLEAGEHVLIKITGQLQLDVYYDAEQQGVDSQGYGTILCPITQQFEFEAGEQIITRITSEVDLVGGVEAVQDRSGPECTLSVLRVLSEGFTMSNRYRHL